MNVIAIKSLRDFWEQYPDAETDLKSWHKTITKKDYSNPNELIHDFPTADIVGNNRVVFNICHNKYRLIVVFRYKIKTVFVRFIGTHKQYDNIEKIKEI